MKFKQGDRIVDVSDNSVKFIIKRTTNVRYELESVCPTQFNLGFRLSEYNYKYVDKYYTWDKDSAKVLYGSADK